MHVPRRARAAVVLTLLAAPPVHAAGQDLVVSAGVGGAARGGRWMPVVITLPGTAGNEGVVVAIWGESIVRRTVGAEVPITTVPLFLRAFEPTETVHVEFQPPGSHALTRDVPVRLLRDDGARLCVREGARVEAADSPCAVDLSPADLPTTARALDAFDAVDWPGDHAGLTADQAEALQTWQATRALIESEGFAAAPRPVLPTGQSLPASDIVRVVATGGMAYLALLAVSLRRASATGGVLRALTLPLLVVLSGTVVAAFVGRAGPGAGIEVVHATSASQIDARHALVTVRGTARFSALDRYAVTIDAPDGSLEVEAYPTRIAAFDQLGRPTMAGEYALGAVVPFTFEGTLPFAPLAVEAGPAGLRVRNVSALPLEACRMTDGYDVHTIGSLPPGSSVNVDAGGSAAKVVACENRSLPIGLADVRHDVRSSGLTIVSVSLPPSPGVAAP